MAVTTREKKPNIIFIVLDTFRDDYTKKWIPDFRRYEFKYYDNTISASPWTAPSHASIFTGVYPITHGTHNRPVKGWKNFRFRSSARSLSFLKNLKETGYSTYLFSANFMISPVFGYIDFDYNLNINIDYEITRKIEALDIKKLKDIMIKHRFSRKESIKEIIRNKDFKLLSKAGRYYILKRVVKLLYLAKYPELRKYPKEKGVSIFIKKIRSLKDHKPKFIFMNLMEVHEPYTKGGGFTLDKMENWKRGRIKLKNVVKWRRKYREHSIYLINKVYNLLDTLMANNLFRDSLIIITSDHGQLLGEYSKLGHGVFLYNELIRVPLLIKYPDKYSIKEARDVEEKYISLTRIKPFLLNLLEKNTIDENLLYTSYAFAEAYGVGFPYKDLEEEIRRNVEKLDKHRIAIYYRNKKAVYNVDEKRFDDEFCDDEDCNDPRYINEINSIIKKFLKRGLIKRRIYSIRMPLK